MEYRSVEMKELNRELFSGFERRQQVTHCWRRVEEAWVIKAVAFTDQWSEAEYGQLVKYLKNTLDQGGVLFAAFEAGNLKGFASVEGKPLGSQKEYLDLSSLHVSEEQRGKGIGKKLFRLAADWARAQGAGKLYISAHSAVETQAFYKSLGCVEARETNREHVEREPYDCQLEYVL